MQGVWKGNGRDYLYATNEGSLLRMSGEDCKREDCGKDREYVSGGPGRWVSKKRAETLIGGGRQGGKVAGREELLGKLYNEHKRMQSMNENTIAANANVVRATETQQSNYSLRERIEILESQFEALRSELLRVSGELYDRVSRLETIIGVPWEPRDIPLSSFSKTR